MQAILAITRLTISAAIRFRLLIVIGTLLLLAVVALPLIIKDDGTAQGFTQILLTYTLSFTTILLGLSTMWIACGTLARDIEEYQIQMLTVKPVPRWQIWLGKWLGIMTLNAILLSLAGASIFFLMKKQAQNLPETQQTILQNEIFVARGSAKETLENLEPIVDQWMHQRLTENPQLANQDQKTMRTQIREQVISAQQVIRPGYIRRWKLNIANPDTLKNQPLYLRIKFFTATPYDTATYTAFWEIGPPEGAQRARIQNTISPEAPIQFEIPPNMIDADGTLTIDFANWNDKPLFFPREDGMEALYKKGKFGPNFARGLILIYCWLGFLCALGLLAASFLSFPIAAFFTLAMLFIGFSDGTLSQIINEGGITGVNTNTGKTAQPNFIDHFSVGAAQSLLWTINLVRDFSPIDNLSTGRLITWTQVAQALFQIIILMSGFLAAIGMTILTRRELATAKSF